MIYDTIIIGSGAAGCSAAIYATRYNLKTLMLGGPMPGGLITEALDVENYPGHLSINGLELSRLFINQAVNLGADYKIESVSDVVINKNEPGSFSVVTETNAYKGRSIIMAMGTVHRKLDVPGEQVLAGRGVSYCATCDGPFFKGKTVAVIGGGNSAVEGAQEISSHAKTVYIVYRSSLRAAPLYVEHMKKNDKVVEVPQNSVKEILGDTLVKSIILENDFNGKRELDVDGVFVQIGYIPRNEIPKKIGIQLTEYGYVKVDQGMGTSIKGIFCAGDLSNSSNQLHQQVTSAAEGAIAAQSAYRLLNGLEYIVN